MKKFAFLMIVALAALSIQARGISPENVPAHVREYVTKNYPEAKNVEWEKRNHGDYYRAEFRTDGKEVQVKISNDGKAFYIKEPIAIKKLPSAITNYINKNYKDVEIMDANRKIDRDYTKYDVYIIFKSDKGYTRHRNVIFDAKGNVIRR